MASKLQVLINSYMEAIGTWKNGESWSPALSHLFKQLLREAQPLVDAMDSRFLPVWQKWIFPQIAPGTSDWKKSFPGVDAVFLHKENVYIASFSNEGNDPSVSFEIEDYASKDTIKLHFFEMKGTIQQAFFLINMFCDFAEMEKEHI